MIETSTARHRKSSNAKPSVAIVGGGVCGLSIAWRLARAGQAVTVYERDEPGGQASWAAAGMLAGGVEYEPGEDALLALNRASQALWPDFAAELRHASGIDCGYRTEGTMVVALNRDEHDWLRRRFALLRDRGIEVEWLGGAEVRAAEPYINPRAVAAILSPLDHQVDNRRLVSALAVAAEEAGAVIARGAPVESLDVSGSRVRGLEVGGRVVPAETVVVAAGAHSGDLQGLPDAVRPPVRPVKGQMMALAMDPAAPLLSHVVWSDRIYLVPRAEGRLIIGGSVEEKGFDTTLTAGATLAMLQAAWRVLPGLEELAIDEMWVGFRPTSRDDAPILGPTAIEGLVMATGHHRNGILLTPMTAIAISDYILTGRLQSELQPFTMQRFAQARTASAGANHV